MTVLKTNIIVPAKGDSITIQANRVYGGDLARESVVKKSAFSIGDIKFSLDLTAPSVDFPWFNLANNDVSLSTTNYPEFVPYLRNRALRYDPLNTNVSTFAVTNWAVASSIATLTFSNTTAENKILQSLAEDNLVHGSFTNWRTVTLSSAIGDIVAGDYAITGISTVARTITFAYASADNSGAGSWTVGFYPYRLVGSTTTARHFAVQGRGFVSVMDADSEWIGNLRRRDRMHGHLHPYGYTSGNPETRDQLDVTGHVVGANYDSTTYCVGPAVTDNINGPPRTGKTTDIRGLAAYPYIYCGTYLP